jgi:hypothetical protein
MIAIVRAGLSLALAWLVASHAACFSPSPTQGAPCGEGGACPSGLVCVDGRCFSSSGECAGRADGDPCGDPSDSACSAPDSCRAGACLPNHAAAGIRCGAAGGSDCGSVEQCNGQGVCESAVVSPGTACYDCASGPGACTACDAQAMCPAATCDSPLVNATLESPSTGAQIAEPGNMFDVVAREPVTIIGFDQDFGLAGDTVFEIYYKTGTHVGFEAMAGAWTRAGSATVTAQTASPVTIPIALDLALAPGDRYAFYLTTTDTGRVRYHTGTLRGAVAHATPELELLEGAGVRYPFLTVFQPRVWQGRIRHRHTARGKLATPAADGNQATGIMFDVTPLQAVRVTDLAVELEPGDHTLAVYFRRGSHAGVEGAPLAWRPLAEDIATTATATGAPTRIPHVFDVQLAAGETAAFYITRGTGPERIRSRQGTAIGTEVATNEQLTILEGVAVGGLFGVPGDPVAPSVELGYRPCP